MKLRKKSRDLISFLVLNFTIEEPVKYYCGPAVKDGSVNTITHANIRMNYTEKKTFLL